MSRRMAWVLSAMAAAVIAIVALTVGASSGQFGFGGGDVSSALAPQQQGSLTETLSQGEDDRDYDGYEDGYDHENDDDDSEHEEHDEDDDDGEWGYEDDEDEEDD